MVDRSVLVAAMSIVTFWSSETTRVPVPPVPGV